MYSDRTHLSVCLSLAACLQYYYCTDLDVTWGNSNGCPLVVHCLGDLQSVAAFRCCGNIHVRIQYSMATGAMQVRFDFPSTLMLFGQLPVKFDRALHLAICTTRSSVYCNPNSVFITPSHVQQKLMPNVKCWQGLLYLLCSGFL